MSITTRLISKFLSSAEIKSLAEDSVLISNHNQWTEGRQHTKYLKHSLRSSSVVTTERHRQLIERSLRCLLPPHIVNQNLSKFSGDSCSLQIPEGLDWDCYLIKYPTKSSIPFHRDVLPATDEAQPKKFHLRLNAIVQNAKSGGSFRFKVDGDKINSWNPSDGDAIIFCPSECEHSVREIDEGERLVWSVGCVLSEKDLTADPDGKARHAMIIGAGEVGRQLHRALSNSGWTCEFVRRNDTEGWKRAVINDDSTNGINLRILAMREEDVGDALSQFHSFRDRSKIVLVQNGFLEAILDSKLIDGVTRGLIYFTSKGDFFSQLTDSLFTGPYARVLADSLNQGGILAREVASAQEFTQHMIVKGIWNSLVGLPLHVHKIPLGDYVDNQSNEIKAIIEESIQVTKQRYGTNLNVEDTWKLFQETTKYLRWMKRSGKASGLAARNGAIQQWGLQFGIPTPATDKLLQLNASLS